MLPVFPDSGKDVLFLSLIHSFIHPLITRIFVGSVFNLCKTHNKYEYMNTYCMGNKLDVVSPPNTLPGNLPGGQGTKPLTD